MSSNKITNLDYHSEKIKIGSAQVEAVVESIGQPETSEQQKEDIKPKIDVAQLKALYSEELKALEVETKKQAEKEGYAEGMKAAEKEFAENHAEQQQTIAQQITLLESVNSKLEQFYSQEIENLDANILEVVFKIISSMVTQADIYSDFIKTTLNGIARDYRDDSLSISIHPKDKVILADTKFNDTMENVTIIEDESIKYGGIIIETEQNTIDARLEKVLTNTKKLLSAAYNE